MIASVLLSFAAFAAPSTLPIPAPVVQDAGTAGADEYQTRMDAAGNDPAALWELHTWCKEQGKIMQARECLKKIVEIEPDHAEARKALGHHLYDGQWFKSYYDLSEYKRAEEKRMLEEKGLVRFNDTEWVPVADEPYLRMGMVKDGTTGKWITKRELDERAQVEKYKADGWQMQTDGVWVAPDQVNNWQKGLWKCGDQWLDQVAADAFHSRVGQWWTVPSSAGHFEIWSTCPYQTITWEAGNCADQTYRDLVRAYGVHPEKKPVVLVLNSQAQYNQFAMGSPETGPATESQGFSSIHYAYFAESWFLPTQPPEYAGTGVCVWNVGPERDPYGRHAVQHAAALAFAESIDPSLAAISRFSATPGQQFPFLEFWLEKKIPLWFRVGVAAYCERYFYDAAAAAAQAAATEAADSEAKEDVVTLSPWWAREWSLDNIRRKGGPKPFEEIFAMALNPNEVEGSAMLINQAGMLVSFILDGKCKPVIQAHDAFKNALKTQGDTAKAGADLRAAIEANADAFSLYVKM